MTDDMNFTLRGGELIDDAAERSRNRRWDRIIARYGEQIARGKDYTNVVVLAGYAAFFALWGGVAADIGPVLRCLAGALLIASATVFVIHEISGMYAQATSTSDFGDLLDIQEAYPSDFEDRWDAMRAAQEKRTAWLYRLWKPCFLFSVTTGVGGAGILAVAMVIKVMRG